MSKVDALRALREAKYAAVTKASARPAAAPVKRPPVATPAVAPAPEAPEGLCGHRNMGGKSCTREADHQRAGTKNHRYA